MHHSLGRLYKAWRGAGRLARLDMATCRVVAGHETQARRAGGDYCLLRAPRLTIILDGSPADYFGVGVRSLMGHEIRGCRREQQQSRTRDDARAIHTMACRLSALRCSNGAMHMSAQVTGAVVFAQSALYVI